MAVAGAFWLRWALAALLLAVFFLAEAWVTLRTGRGARLDGDVASVVLNTIDERIRLDLSPLARPGIIVVLTPLVALLLQACLARPSWRRACSRRRVPRPTPTASGRNDSVP